MTSLSEKLLANKRFAFTSDAFSEDKFEVVTMQGYESISRPFRFELTLVSDDADIDFEQMLQSQVAFTIYAPDGKQPTPYHGMVAEFDQLHESGGYIFYRVVMVPRIWQLSLYQISEVYLEEKPIPALIKQVLESANFNSNDFEIKTNGQYRDRSFVCQYQESHLDFISRWMEKEGMYYWFDHGQQHDKIIIADDKVMHVPDAVQVNYRPVDELDTGVAPDSVQSFSCRQKPLPKQVILQDFNHRKASTELKATATVSERGIGEVMFYGENFRTNEEGERYANLRAQEILARSKFFMGESTAVGLRCGFFMQLNHHFRDAFNSQYLITEIEHQGSQAGALLNGIRTPYNADESGAVTSYSNSFQAIAADTQFRPERITPKPKVAGTMNAVIDAEGSGEYADLDEFGQYKVQLPFDRTDKKENKGSARVRMASPYAGNEHGMHFPLHKKSEVLLSFTDGDPDQPVILSSVSNSENKNIIGADKSTENTIVTAGGNKMVMSDKAGGKGVAFYSPSSKSFLALGFVAHSEESKDEKNEEEKEENKGGIFACTAGSSTKVVLGVDNKFGLGSENKLTAGMECSANFGIKYEADISAKVGFGLSSNVNWEFGRNINFHESSGIDFEEEKDVKAAKSIKFSAGQNELLDERLKILKNRIKYATAANFATNMAAAVATTATLASKADAGESHDNDGEIERKNPYSYGFLAGQLGLGLVGTAASQALLQVSANEIAKTLSADDAYKSNIEINDKEVKLSHGGNKNSNIVIDNTKVELSQGGAGNSNILLDNEKVELSQGGSDNSSILVDKNSVYMLSGNDERTFLSINRDGGTLACRANFFHVAEKGMMIKSEQGSIGIGEVFATSVAKKGGKSIKISTATKGVLIKSKGSALAVSEDGLIMQGQIIRLG